MRKVELLNEYCSSPANSDYQIITHPSGDISKCIEIALFNEHRFAFYFWIKWNQEASLSYEQNRDFWTPIIENGYKEYITNIDESLAKLDFSVLIKRNRR